MFNDYHVNDMVEREEYYNETGRYVLSIGDTLDDYDVVWKSDNERK